MTSSIEIIRPFADLLAQERVSNVQIIGGIGSVALSHSSTIIDSERRRIIVPHPIDMPTIRADGSKRDVDVLVLSSDAREIKDVDQTVRTVVGKELEASVFGMKSAETLQKQIARPLGFSVFKTFLSDRYQSSDGHVKALFPFAVPIDPESLETWSLEINNMILPVPHPAMSIINYATRSITGLRPKDAEKVEYMAQSTFSKSPELLEWALDGPGRSQVELARLLQQLTPRKVHSELFEPANKKLTVDQLHEHEAFMLSDLDRHTNRQVLAVAAFKAGALSFFESHPAVVALWRKIGERNLEFIVKNT